MIRRMSRAPRGFFLDATLLVLAGIGPVLYPLWLAWRTTRQTPRTPVPAIDTPAISVVLPAYLEAGVLPAKIANVQGNGFGAEVEVIVVADDPASARVAREAGAVVIESPERTGKSGALNAGISAATHEIVVLTDVNAMLSPGALAHLVDAFADPAVMAAAGEKRLDGVAEGLYWRFESWLKRREWETGSTIGLVGELAAVRRDAFRPLPHDVAVDDLWLALDVAEAGGRIAYVPEAFTTEQAEESLDAQWERRTRVVAGTLDVLWRRRRLLLPGTTSVTDQLWGHRLARSTLGPLAHLALLVRWAARSRVSWLARVLVLVHGIGAAAVIRQTRGAPLTSPERSLAQVLFLQAVALGGLARYLRRERLERWPKVDRSKETTNGAGKSP
jgi:poly-beta-1,6-N-acetyl-D-glucosamine synthase